MQKNPALTASFIMLLMAVFTACTNQPAADKPAEQPAAATAAPANGGYENQVKWGEHLVAIMGCNDCHTPRKMTDKGPVPDMDNMLSGHPAQMPPPPIDRKMAEAKGLAVTQTLTAWVGPWGISYAANLTPDSTGIGQWKEEQFMYALRNGKFKGLESSRTLLPPMPWEAFKNASDDEIKAIFAYLKSIKPVHNIVPDAAPPVTAMK